MFRPSLCTARDKRERLIQGGAEEDWGGVGTLALRKTPGGRALGKRFCPSYKTKIVHSEFLVIHFSDFLKLLLSRQFLL